MILRRAAGSTAPATADGFSGFARSSARATAADRLSGSRSGAGRTRPPRRRGAPNRQYQAKPDVSVPEPRPTLIGRGSPVFAPVGTMHAHGLVLLSAGSAGSPRLRTRRLPAANSFGIVNLTHTGLGRGVRSRLQPCRHKESGYARMIPDITGCDPKVNPFTYCRAAQVHGHLRRSVTFLSLHAPLAHAWACGRSASRTARRTWFPRYRRAAAEGRPVAAHGAPHERALAVDSGDVPDSVTVPKRGAEHEW